MPKEQKTAVGDGDELTTVSNDTGVAGNTGAAGDSGVTGDTSDTSVSGDTGAAGGADADSAGYVLAMTAEDSIAAELYINTLRESGIPAVIKCPKPYLQKFVNFGYEKNVEIYVPAGMQGSANDILELIKSEPFTGGAADIETQPGDSGGDDTGAGPSDTGDFTEDDTNAGPSGAREKNIRSKTGFIFLMLILLLPTIAAVYAVILRIIE